MFRTEDVGPDHRDMERIRALYVRSFPENERGPLEPLVTDPSGCARVAAFYEDAAFLGFACLLIHSGLCHIIYFAIDDAHRGRGYGTLALRAMEEMAGCRVMVDVERERPDAPNNEQRARRLRFYARNGYVPSEVGYTWRGESYTVLVKGGNLTADAFGNFWENLVEINEDFYQY